MRQKVLTATALLFSFFADDVNGRILGGERDEALSLLDERDLEQGMDTIGVGDVEYTIPIIINQKSMYYTEEKKDNRARKEDGDNDYEDTKLVEYKCNDIKKDEPIVVESGLATTSTNMEGDLTSPGERLMWYSESDSGLCTVLDEPSMNATDSTLVALLCKKLLTWPYQSDYPSSTIALSGILTPGGGNYTITGGTGCFAGKSGISISALTGSSYTETIYLD